MISLGIIDYHYLYNFDRVDEEVLLIPTKL